MNSSGRTIAAGNSFLRTRSPEESQELHDILGILFTEVEEWHEAIAETLENHPNSALGIASDLTAPFQASHAVSYLRLTAVDHLHALRTLMKEARAQHIFAPFTLLRASLENAATALWILSDPAPRSIAVRTLKLEWANLCDLEKAHKTVDAPEEAITVRKRTFEDLLLQNGLKKDGIKANPPGALKIIQQATTAFGLGSNPVLMWQMCSAAMHGRKWVTGFLTMMDAQDDGISKVISGRLTSDEQAIVQAAYAACALVRRLFQVQEMRSRPEGHLGESFKEPTQKLIVPPRGLALPRRFTSSTKQGRM